MTVKPSCHEPRRVPRHGRIEVVRRNARQTRARIDADHVIGAEALDSPFAVAEGERGLAWAAAHPPEWSSGRNPRCCCADSPCRRWSGTSRRRRNSPRLDVDRTDRPGEAQLDALAARLADRVEVAATVGNADEVDVVLQLGAIDADVPAPAS